MAFPAAIPAPSRIAAILLAVVATASATRAQDPFAPGLRWTQASDAAAPAIPRAVAFGADENAAWVAWSGSNPGVSASAAHATGPNDALAREPAPTGSTGSFGLAAGAAPWTYALVQIAAPDALHRRTVVRASWFDDASAAGVLTPHWTRELPFASNGPARVATDASGSSAWVAAYDDATQRVRVERFDGASGATIFAREIDAQGLQELVVAADGSRAAISAGLRLVVLDALGATVHQANLLATTTALAISGDGRAVAHGTTGALRVLRDGAQGFALATTTAAGAGELAVRAALDGDGGTLAIGWWNSATGVAWRFEVRDVEHDVRLEERRFVGVAGGLQDLPTAVALTANGARAAFACWGSGTSDPEAAIWDRASDLYALEADLPGSAFALALDATGTRAIVAAKSTHANVLSGTGDVHMLDTGERDLQVLERPRVGGVLHLAARAPGATSVMFLQGDPVAIPFRVPGVAGVLRLRRVGLGVARLAADGQGRADWTSAIPADSSWIGTTRSFQAAFRGTGWTRLGTTLVRVRIL